MENINLSRLLLELKNNLKQTKNFQAAIEQKNEWIKKYIVQLQIKIKDQPFENKKKLGKLINQLKIEADLIFEKIKNRYELESFNKVLIDPSVKNETLLQAHPHWLNNVIQRSCEWFAKMNFKIEQGNEIVSQIENFDLLNINQNHPARINSDSFYFDQKYMLRTHNTCHSAKVLLEANPKAELRVVTFGNVYRNDTDDATHSHQFSQIDFIWVQKNLSLANLKWIVQNFLNYVFEKKVKVRFRPSFFPFTEPSFEVDVSCATCAQFGCNICKKTGWIEILGSGMINYYVLKNTGYDPNEYNAVAAGIGCERLAMIKYMINDIRYFYNNDTRFFRE